MWLGWDNKKNKTKISGIYSKPKTLKILFAIDKKFRQFETVPENLKKLHQIPALMHIDNNN